MVLLRLRLTLSVEQDCFILGYYQIQKKYPSQNPFGLKNVVPEIHTFLCQTDSLSFDELPSASL
jgi:hypothetical protein